MSEPETFADISFANLTHDEARCAVANTPPGSKAHVEVSLHPERYMVLVEDLPISGARDLLIAVAEFRSTNSLDFPGVPNWRDIRTGSDRAWRDFAEAHNIVHPAGASRERVAMAVRSWLEKNR